MSTISATRWNSTVPAERIISLAPHITESLFAVGAGDKIVATVLYSDFPEAAANIPIIGSHREVSYESLVALNPDLIVVWASGNGDEIAARIRGLGLKLYLDEPRELEDIPRTLRRFGILTGNEAKGNEESEKFLERLSFLQQRYTDSRVVDVFYQVWNDPLTTLNGEHLVSDIIRLCGGRNVFAESIPIAPVVSLESVLTANPEVVVASGMAEERPDWLDEWRGWTGLAAVENEQLGYVPPDLLQRSSPRVIQGAEMMCEIIDQARAVYPQ